jgi:hypothetical protein
MSNAFKFCSFKTVFVSFTVRISAGTRNYFVSLLSHATNMPGYCLVLGHDQFLSHDLQFCIFNHPDIRHYITFFITFFNPNERHERKKYLFLFGEEIKTFEVNNSNYLNWMKIIHVRSCLFSRSERFSRHLTSLYSWKPLAACYTPWHHRTGSDLGRKVEKKPEVFMKLDISSDREL